MSYSTYTIDGGILILDNKPMRTQLYAKKKFIAEAEQDGEDYTDHITDISILDTEMDAMMPSDDDILGDLADSFGDLW